MDHTLVQPFSDTDMQNPDVKKKLKAFDDNIATNISKNEILADSKYPPEGWHSDADDIENSHLPYDPEADIKEAYYYTE